MPGRFKLLPFALIGLLAMGAFAAQADVTGSFSTHIQIRPETTATEISALLFDIQNEINLTVVISGLSTTLHSHFGLAGVEDIQLTYAATLGALDLTGQLVFGRFAFGAIAPFYDKPHFLAKIARTEISLSGVTFAVLGQFEDTRAFISQSPGYAFGSAISLEGETPSGISVSGTTGICMEKIPFSFKKHFRLSDYSVNPDCATSPKPDLMFDFEDLHIEGIPVASGVTADALVECVRTTDCELTSTFNVTGVGPVPFTANLDFSDLFPPHFDGAELEFSAGAGTFTVMILPNGKLGAVELDLSTTLNPDTNPATLEINAELIPGFGLVNAVTELTVSRSDLDFSITAVFAGVPVTFQGVVFSIGSTIGAVDVETEVVFIPSGFLLSDTTFTLNF